MMFLQFFLWGSWFVTLGHSLGSNGLTDIIASAYGTAPLAAIIAPLFLGLIADRFFPSEKVMGALLLVGGVLMCLVPGAAEAKNGQLVILLFTGHMFCYMPTLGLGNTIAFSNIKDQNLFPKIRVWGTIGWIVAGLLNGFMGTGNTFVIFWMAGVASLLLGLFSFLLPNTPAPAKGQPLNLKALFMVDAFALLKQPAFLVFIICSTLLCIPLAYYYSFTSNYLSNVGFKEAASSMSLGQMSEIIFMILVPFFLRKLGVKYMLLVGMLAWVLRYGLFAAAATNQVAWMLFVGVLLHGICYDFFFVTGFMYTDKISGKEIKGQAQSMLVFFTQGVGMFFGFKIAGSKFGETVASHYESLTNALSQVAHAEQLSQLQKLGRMFSVEKLGVDPTLVDSTMQAWKSFWTLPAIMAGVIAVIFFLGFWYKEPAEK